MPTKKLYQSHQKIHNCGISWDLSSTIIGNLCQVNWKYVTACKILLQTRSSFAAFKTGELKWLAVNCNRNSWDIKSLKIAPPFFSFLCGYLEQAPGKKVLQAPNKIPTTILVLSSLYQWNPTERRRNFEEFYFLYISRSKKMFSNLILAPPLFSKSV